MSLINQFKITLKDFLPDPSDGMIITDRARGTNTTVSNRLFAELISYTDGNRHRLNDIVAQLREEIHRQPATIKFAKGDRVKLTSKGIQLIPSMDMHCSGTIVFTPIEGQWIAVCWDSTDRHRYIDPDLLERSDD